MKTALIAGATGLVGAHLLEQVLADERYGAVHVAGRRRPALAHDKLRFHETDFERVAIGYPVDHVFCCLGTTMKNAGSREAFRRVDHDYVVHLAAAARAAGARTFALVSAVGARKDARTFYTRVKGETEDAVAALGFPACIIIRPSLLIGARDERRLGEGIAKAASSVLNKVLVGGMAKYRSVRAEDVARAMALLVWQQEEGLRVVESDQIENLLGSD